MSEPWVMTIPVISTLHAPGADALKALREKIPYCEDQGLGTLFVFLGSTVEGDWIDAIGDWVFANFKEHWVRFDPDGDVIDELPTFEEEWE